MALGENWRRYLKLAGYLRVSTEGQVDAFGKDVQKEFIEKFAGQANHEIVTWYEEDAVSGKTEASNRPSFHQMLIDHEERPESFEGIVALDTTRFARDLLVQETLFATLWKNDLEIFCANGGLVDKDDEQDPTRKFTRRLFGLLAELERDTLYMRMHNGRRRKIESGGYGGGSPKYGWKVEGRKGSAELVPCANEQAVIQSILDMRDEGLSYKKIALSLNSCGVKTKRNCSWRERQISRILEERDE